jgi:hypothetical protein
MQTRLRQRGAWWPRSARLDSQPVCVACSLSCVLVASVARSNRPRRRHVRSPAAVVRDACGGGVTERGPFHDSRPCRRSREAETAASKEGSCAGPDAGRPSRDPLSPASLESCAIACSDSRGRPDLAQTSRPPMRGLLLGWGHGRGARTPSGPSAAERGASLHGRAAPLCRARGRKPGRRH